MHGPDLPPAHEPMTVEAVLVRWPTGAWKRELMDGVLYFYGEFDERDVAAAERVYIGRRGLVNRAGDLEIHPAGPGTLCSILEPGPAEETST